MQSETQKAIHAMMAEKSMDKLFADFRREMRYLKLSAQAIEAKIDANLKQKEVE